MRNLLVIAVAAMLLGCGGDSGESCTPDCEGRECGDDGCGGECGPCGAGSACAGMQCIACTPQCTGHQCGPDGCGKSCGACDEGQVCDPLSQLCTAQAPDCESKCDEFGFTCGPDGCGGSCGECSDETFCKPEVLQCQGECTPECSGKQCGDDGCGSVCGDCLDGFICVEDQCVPAEEDEFVVLFGYQGRIQSYNDDQFDLHLLMPDRTNPFYPDTPGPQALTDFSLATADDCQLVVEDDLGREVGYEPCSCKYGCLVDPSLEWIAVSVKKPGATGFTFQLGRFDQALKVSMVKGVFLENVIDFKFAGNFLYYTKQFYCDGVHCQYTFHRVQLDPVAPPEELFVFPPESDDDWPEHSNYKGHFKASEDGSVLVILGTTIRSVRYYMWTGGNLHELDYVCNQFVNGTCIGAGSEYTDTDPVAIAPDGSKVAAFTIAERELRIRVYDTETLTPKSYPLFSIPSEISTPTYLAGACQAIADSAWKFKRVVGDPRFSPDGSSIYFISHTDCGVVSVESKVHTNILMMDLASVGDGTLFEEGDFVNLTKNAKGDGPDNLVVESFSISPSGRTVVFAASPKYKFAADPMNPVMQPILEDSPRARKDRELWLVTSAGTGLTQLTDNLEFEAISPRALDLAVLPGYNGR